MGKDQNSYARRQREIKKKRKAEEKRERRRKKKEGALAPVETNLAEPPAASD